MRIGRPTILLTLVIKPIIFSVIAWRLNVEEEYAGFLLIGGAHLLIAFYYLSCLYISSKKETTLLSKHI
ncbi:MAG: hypothetical protein KAG20_06030 [Cocleimonas sp.]|nr:hypothetical protein [Cocleimonas sp.]